HARDGPAPSRRRKALVSRGAASGTRVIRRARSHRFLCGGTSMIREPRKVGAGRPAVQRVSALTAGPPAGWYIPGCIESINSLKESTPVSGGVDESRYAGWNPADR